MSSIDKAGYKYILRQSLAKIANKPIDLYHSALLIDLLTLSLISTANAAPCATPPLPLPLPPPLPLRQAPHGASHGALTPAMAALTWRASTKLIFLRGITKMDAHDLHLAILALNLIRNEP
jgi:hypothetical protein